MEGGTDDKQRKNKYGTCSFFSDGKCGAHSKRTPPIDCMFHMSDITEDVKPHLVALHVMKGQDSVEPWSERNLIENRIGRQLQEGEELCAYHRYSYGISWKQTKSCSHPDHAEEKRKKVPLGRVAPVERALKMQIPIGSILCHRHRLSPLPSTPSRQDIDDDDYVPPEVINSPSTLDKSIEKGVQMASALESSPMKYRFTSQLEDVAPTTMKKMYDKMKRWEDSTRKQFALTHAPGQEADLLEAFRRIEEGDEEGDDHDDIPEDIPRGLEEPGSTIHRQ